MLLKVGDPVRWMCPLDNDYTYGKILDIRKSVATVQGVGLYSKVTAEVYFKYIEKYKIGGINRGSTD